MPVTIGIKSRRGQHEIDIFPRIETQQLSGEIKVTYGTTSLTPGRRAYVFTKTGREFRQATQIVAEIGMLLSIRFVAGDDLRPLMKISFRGRELQIIVAENVNELDQEWWLYCREVVI